MDRMKKLSDTIRTLMEEEFSGYIRINFSQGSLGRVEKSEEIEDVAVVLLGKKEEEKVEELSTTMKKLPAHDSPQKKIQAIVSVFVLLTMTSCAPRIGEQILQPGDAAGPAMNRIVQPGDTVDVHYLCRLQSGEIAAATESVPDDQPKSGIFVKRKDADPVLVTATAPGEAFVAKQEEPFEREIANRMSNKVAGMKEGETRRVQVSAEDIPARDAQSFIVRLSRVRTRAKEVTMPISEYQARTQKVPEKGQAFAFDPAFPGSVETVTDKDVAIRFFAQPGSVIETPFGPGRVREEGPNYKVDIDARKNGLTRAGSMIGRITEVDDRSFTVDYRNPFGKETLACDVTIGKIVGAKTAESGTGK